MQRILLIGSPGAGKSTLGQHLHERTDIPLLHLDQLFWQPGWVERAKPDFDERLNRVLSAERWIIDGNYGSSLPRRIAHADTVVWLDYPTMTCLWRLVRRWTVFRGRSRPDMSEGCPERLDPTFLWYVATFRRRWHARNAEALASFKGTVVRLPCPAAAEAWLEGLPAKG